MISAELFDYGWQLIKWILGPILALIAFFGKKKIGQIDDDLKSHGDSLNDHNSKIIRLQAETVSEGKVREIVKEEVQPIHNILEEIKDSQERQQANTQQLLIEIAKQQGYNDAKKDFIGNR